MHDQQPGFQPERLEEVLRFPITGQRPGVNTEAAGGSHLGDHEVHHRLTDARAAGVSVHGEIVEATEQPAGPVRPDRRDTPLTPGAEEKSSYTERLLKAKRQAWNENEERKGNSDQP